MLPVMGTMPSETLPGRYSIGEEIAHAKVKPVLQKLDHAAIYLLIAGTYTPLHSGQSAWRLGLDPVWPVMGYCHRRHGVGTGQQDALQASVDKPLPRPWLAGPHSHQTHADVGRNGWTHPATGGRALLLSWGNLLCLEKADLSSCRLASVRSGR